MSQTESVVEDGMRIIWDAGIHMDDGVVLSADIFLPEREGHYPVLLSYGPYAKGLSFQEGYPSAWQRMIELHPDVVTGSSGKYQSWEVADPEKWVPDGYVCVRVDSRGAGRSPGVIDPFSRRETSDLYQCIEWAGVQDWSNGRVGLAGISYYAINQWQVAALQPPHLAAICPWEGALDWYRDSARHGGILSTFWQNWYDMQVKTVQFGLGDRGPKSSLTGRNVCGDITLDDDELAKNRIDIGDELRNHPFVDEYYAGHTANITKVAVPLFSAGNWGGQGLHFRGNVEGYLAASSGQKWLEMHGIEHWTHFYTDYGRGAQKRFFDFFLKAEDTGWSSQPPVLLNIRRIDGTFSPRNEQEWPLRRTKWTRVYFDASSMSMGAEPAVPSSVSFNAVEEGASFAGGPLPADTEITGPSKVKLWVSSSTDDADLFVVLRLFDPEGEEVTFQGAIDPHTPIAQGWLRLSHRDVDSSRSAEYRPFHPHTRALPVVPGTVYEADIEVLPTCVVAPAGYRLALTVQGRDYEYPKAGQERLSNFKNVLKGCGPSSRRPARPPLRPVRRCDDHPLWGRPGFVPTSADYPSLVVAG